MAFSNHDVRPDTPINNFATLNPLANGGTLEEGNLRFKHVGNDAAKSALSTFLLPNSGTYYWEIYEETAIPNNSRVSFGICNSIHASKAAQSEYIIFETDSHGYSDRTNVDNPQFRINGNVVGTFNTDYTINYGSGGVISFYVNMDTNEFTVGRNDAAYKTYSFPRKYNITYSIFFNLFCDGSQTLSQVINFGQDPTFAGNKTPTKVYTDSNGQGRFYYEPPAGALALCSRNIDNPKNVPTTYIVDETNANMLTYNGNTEISTFSPYAADGYSIAFDGTNDHLTVPSSVVNFGLNPFSFEFWYYPMSNNSGSGTYQVFLDARTNGAVKYLFGLKDGRLYYYMGESSTEYFSDSTLGPNYVSPNRWSHILFAQDGANFRIYLNGTRVYTIAKTALYGNDGFVPADTTAFIGESKSGGRVSGHLADIRIRKGTSFYDITGDTITVPSSSFTGNDVTNATFLQSTSSKLIKDTSSSATTISTVGAPSIAAWSPYTSIDKQTGFELPSTTNGGSFYFDDSNSRIEYNYQTALGTQDFRMEFWVNLEYKSGKAYSHLFDQRNQASGDTGYGMSCNFSWHTDDGVYAKMYFLSGNNSSVANTTKLRPNQWHHIVLIRDYALSGGTFKSYIDTVEQTSWSSTTAKDAYSSFNFNRPLQPIGYTITSSTLYYIGYVTDIKVDAETAGGGNIDLSAPSTNPPNKLSKNGNYTKLLLQPFQPKSSVNSSVFNITDSYNKGEADKNLTYFGNTKVVDFSPYKGGSHGSFSFDGTGDYLTFEDSNNLFLGDFTVECWFYRRGSSAGNHNHLLGNSPNSSDGFYWAITDTTSPAGKFQLYFNGAIFDYDYYTPNEIPINSWTHLAISVSGSTANAYINGIEKASVNNFPTDRATGIGSTYSIGRGATSGGWSSQYTHGIIADFRIVGSGVYTSNFTPPYDELTSVTNTTLLLQPGKVAGTDNEAAKDPDAFFKCVNYSGNGDANNKPITTVGFKPDFVWIKKRDTNGSGGAGHIRTDSVSGVGTGKSLYHTADIAGTNDAHGYLLSMNSDGFTVKAGSDGSAPNNLVNDNGSDYVAWCFRAGGAPTHDNTATSGAMNANGSAASSSASSVSLDGVLQSSYTPSGSPTIYPKRMSIGTKQGFSIVKYGGSSASSSTVPHGLGKAPEMIIVKNLDSADAWVVYHKSVASDAETDYLVLNTTAAAADATVWNDTAPTNQVFSIGQGGSISENGENFIAYCWHSVPGYSVFGSYIGKGSNPQPFVYIGFKPAFIMIKGVDDNGLNSYQGWSIFDTARDDYNPAVKPLYANASHTEGVAGNGSGTVGGIDLLSNGFRILDGTASYSGIDGIRHIYMAFAELPFSYARGR